MKIGITALAIFASIGLGFSQKPTEFHSNAWQQEVNFKIQVRLNDENQTLSAFEEIEYINKSPKTLDTIYMHLWPNAYRNYRSALAKQQYNSGKKNLYYGDMKDRGSIDSLDFKVNGVQVQWKEYEGNPDIGYFILPSSLLPGSKVTITTPFSVKIPSGEISRLGHIDQSYQITQWYPKPAVYDANGWNMMPYLNQGEFYSEYGSFDVSITVPQNYVVAATGDLQDQSELDFLDSLVAATKINIPKFLQTKQGGGATTDFPASSKLWKTIHFKQSHVHDFAWFADKRFAVLKGEVTLPNTSSKVTSWAMFVPHNTLTWQNAIEYINDGTYYYSLWNGDYPYHNVTAIDGTISAGGGMEYPNVTVIGNASSAEELEVVIVHEVGHNWFYGILGSNERVHGWMDEGLNTLNEMRYVETKYPNNKRLSDMVLNGKFHLNDLDHHDMGDVMYRMLAAFGKDQAIETHSADFSSINYGAIMYQKTGLVFYYLKDYLGTELFDQCMQKYFNLWKFKHPQPQDLQRVFEETTGKKLDWFFNDLIQTTDHIDYKISKVKFNKDGGVVQVKNKGKVDGPIEVNVINKDKSMNSYWVEPGQTATSISSKKEAVDYVMIDANRDIPELNRSNNYYYPNIPFFMRKQEPLGLEFFSGDNEGGKNNIFWLPIIAGNSNDRTMLGVAVHNYGLGPRPTQYLIAPMYSFGRKMVSGIAEVSHTFYPENFFRSSKLGVSAKSFSTNGISDNPRGAYFVGISPYLLLEFGKKKNNPSITRTLLIKTIARHDQWIDNSSNLILNQVGAMLSYSYLKSKADYKYSNETRLESMQHFKGNDNMLRISSATQFEFKYLRNKMDRWISLRAYIGYNLYSKSSSWIMPDKYMMSLSGAAGTQDNYLENYYFDRYNTAGIQRYDNMGGFRSTYNLLSNSWMASVNATMQLPIKPDLFVAFADFGLRPNSNPNNPVTSFVNTGLGIKISSFVGIYFPLWRSWNMSNMYANYGKEIRLTLKFNPAGKPMKLSALMK